MLVNLQISILLGRSLYEFLDSVTSEELTWYYAYVDLYGLPNQRMEAISANGMAVIAQSLGAKIKASDLLPKMNKEKRIILNAEDTGKLLKAFAQVSKRK